LCRPHAGSGSGSTERVNEDNDQNDTNKDRTCAEKTVPAQKKTVPTQKKTVPAQKKSSAAPAAKPAAKVPEAGTVKIGTQVWAIANLNVVTFRNGDTIPEARTNEEWVSAGKRESRHGVLQQ